MAEIAIVHPKLATARTGAEAICVNVIEALQRDHEVSVVSRGKVDFGVLNRFFDTKIDPDQVTTDSLGPAYRAFKKIFRTDRFSHLQTVLQDRIIEWYAADFDLLFNTYRVLHFAEPILQYVHYPLRLLSAPDENSPPAELYYRLVAALQRDGDLVRDDTVVTNSRWTAREIRKLYDVEPEVVHPPVTVEPPADRSWRERERGFVCIGRLEALKRIVENIEVVARLRERGHDVHLHIIGPPFEPDYRRRVANEAEKHDFVHLEGEVAFEELVDAIHRHRYGLHGKLEEHFGIAVAQMVAGGMIPFVPDGGGQVEVVGGNDALLYESTADAVDKIDRVLSRPTLQRELREHLRGQQPALRPERFHDEIRRVVDEALGRNREEAR